MSPCGYSGWDKGEWILQHSDGDWRVYHTWCLWLYVQFFHNQWKWNKSSQTHWSRRFFSEIQRVAVAVAEMARRCLPFNLRDDICKQILPRDIEKEDEEEFFKFIRQNQFDILLVLDGLDELLKRDGQR